MRRLAALFLLTIAAHPARAQTSPMIDDLARRSQLPNPDDQIVDCASAGRAARNIAHARDLGMPIAEVLRRHQADSDAMGKLVYLQRLEEDEIRDIYAHPTVTAAEAQEIGIQACGWVPIEHLADR